MGILKNEKSLYSSNNDTIGLTKLVR